METSFSFISLIISILAIFFSLSKIQISLFEERYAVFCAAKKHFFKLISQKNYIDLMRSFNEADLLEVEELSDKAYFLFGGNLAIQKELEFMKSEINFYFLRPMYERESPEKITSDNNFYEASNHFEKTKLILKAKEDNQVLKKAFEPYLKISYFSFLLFLLRKFACKVIKVSKGVQS
jgi:hypothetical protein